jgi:hypothetical protein
MFLETKPHYTYSFGSMGRTLETARTTGFFLWFHMEESERREHEPGELVRLRPSGKHFHHLCCLDVLMSLAGELVQIELVVERSFVDGVDGLFAQDLVNSFLHASLPDACRSVLEDFISEINTPAGEGQTPAFQVFKGRMDQWSTQTGWSQLTLANIPVGDATSLVVHLGPNPTAPNATQVVDRG